MQKRRYRQDAIIQLKIGNFAETFPQTSGDLSVISVNSKANGNTSAAAWNSMSSSNPAWAIYAERQRSGFLTVLFLVSRSQFFDRNVISILLEPIKEEFNVSDTMLGMLGGPCFAFFYAIAGIPVARWTDRGNRRTVITLALTFWSVMTMLCGLAQAFWQLAVARVGVGTGESGGIQASQSLIIDYFLPARRTTAIAILMGGDVAGNVLGLAIGGYVAAIFGWRSVFLLAGALGLVLAVIVRFTLTEPRLWSDMPFVRKQAENLGQAISLRRRKHSYVPGLVGSVLYYLFAYGPPIFIPLFLTRNLHIPLVNISKIYGPVVAVGSLIGTLAGGLLADRLSRRDVRWLAWLPAVVFALACPVYLITFTLASVPRFMALVFVGNVLLLSGLPSTFSALHAVGGSPRRATAFGIVYFSASLVGGGLGLLACGALSDGLNALYGADGGLHYALMTMTKPLVISGVLFYFFGCGMKRDLEE